tara:strand:+ start:425 stop:1462 length:1038 start_codon:yes stop_codon:yes gene_type:complete
MRSHNLRASLASASGGGGSGGSFSRGFYGGTGTSLVNINGTYYTAGSSYSSTTKEEIAAWGLEWNNKHTLHSLYYDSHFYQTVVTAKELTDASVPSGAKFNKLSQYVWGDVGTNSSKVPKGQRWIMHHTTDTNGLNNTGGYSPKSGESRVLLYQDQASTYFPPLASAAAQKASGDTTIASMHLQGKSTLNGAKTAASGTGYLVEINAGGGDDSSVSPASYFTWNGTNDVVIELSTTKASYDSECYKGMYKPRGWKPDVTYQHDYRADCHYGSTTWIGGDPAINSSYQGAFTNTTGNLGGSHKMSHSNTTESDNWYDITNSEWQIAANTTYNLERVVAALKLDYTT